MITYLNMSTGYQKLVMLYNEKSTLVGELND